MRLTAFFWFLEGKVGINQTAGDGNINSDKIQHREFVIVAEHHSEISHKQVFHAADDCSCQTGVVLRAENDRVHEDEAHKAGGDELNDEHWICPFRKGSNFFKIAF